MSKKSLLYPLDSYAILVAKKEAKQRSLNIKISLNTVIYRIISKMNKFQLLKTSGNIGYADLGDRFLFIKM